jgi:hypothetical protein
MRTWSRIIWTIRTGALLLLLATAGTAGASHWNGENGMIRFSFTAGEELQGVTTAGPNEHGMTEVELHAWLTDIQPVAIDGEAFLHLGGYEFQLLIEGAEAFVTGTTLPTEAVNMANAHLAYVVGMRVPLRIEDGRVLLASWKLMFQGEPRDVRFSIAPEGVVSCEGTEGCEGSGTRALYIGSMDAKLVSEIFGAGCVPAWLNPTGEPDLTPLTSTSTWQEVGRAEAREPRR